MVSICEFLVVNLVCYGGFGGGRLLVVLMNINCSDCYHRHSFILEKTEVSKLEYSSIRSSTQVFHLMCYVRFLQKFPFLGVGSPMPWSNAADSKLLHQNFLFQITVMSKLYCDVTLIKPPVSCFNECEMIIDRSTV